MLNTIFPQVSITASGFTRTGETVTIGMAVPGGENAFLEVTSSAFWSGDPEDEGEEEVTSKNGRLYTPRFYGTGELAPSPVF